MLNVYKGARKGRITLHPNPYTYADLAVRPAEGVVVLQQIGAKIAGLEGPAQLRRAT